MDARIVSTNVCVAFQKACVYNIENGPYVPPSYPPHTHTKITHTRTHTQTSVEESSVHTTIITCVVILLLLLLLMVVVVLLLRRRRSVLWLAVIGLRLVGRSGWFGSHVRRGQLADTPVWLLVLIHVSYQISYQVEGWGHTCKQVPCCMYVCMYIHI